MEARFLPKLIDYNLKVIHPGQTGFVPGNGIFVNIERALRRIIHQTSQNRHVYGLFIDFSNAYNSIIHELLFSTLQDVLTQKKLDVYQDCIVGV